MKHMRHWLMMVMLLCCHTADAYEIGDCVYTRLAKFVIAGDNLVSNGLFRLGDNGLLGWSPISEDCPLECTFEMKVDEHYGFNTQKVIPYGTSLQHGMYQKIPIDEKGVYIISFKVKGATKGYTDLDLTDSGTNYMNAYYNSNGELASYNQYKDGYITKVDYYYGENGINGGYQFDFDSDNFTEVAFSLEVPSAGYILVDFRGLSEQLQIADVSCNFATEVFDERIVYRRIEYFESLLSFDGETNISSYGKLFQKIQSVYDGIKSNLPIVEMSTRVEEMETTWNELVCEIFENLIDSIPTIDGSSNEGDNSANWMNWSTKWNKLCSDYTGKSPWTWNTDRWRHSSTTIGTPLSIEWQRGFPYDFNNIATMNVTLPPGIYYWGVTAQGGMWSLNRWRFLRSWANECANTQLFFDGDTTDVFVLNAAQCEDYVFKFCLEEEKEVALGVICNTQNSADGFYVEFYNPILYRVINGASKLTVNLFEMEVGELANMYIEITNSTGEVVCKYLIGENSTYTFYNLDKMQTYNVYLKSKAGSILGTIQDIHISEDTTVTFDSLQQPQNLKIGIYTPDGTDVTKSAIVTWYDADGNYLCKDALLNGQVENTEVKYSVKLSKELALQYKQPEQATYMVKPSGNEIKVILEPFSTAEITGMVRDSVTGTPISDAMVTFSQLFNGEYAHITRAETDSKGAFKANIYDVPAEVTVAVADYISYTMSLDTLTEATALGDILMKPISGVVVSVGFTYRTSVPDGDTPEILGWYTDYANVKYGIQNKTTGLPVSNFSVQYPQLVLLDGVSAGDELLLTVVSRTGSFEPTQTTAVVDSALQCDVTFDIVELGGIEASYTSTTNSAVVGILYNEIGEMVQKRSYSSGSLTLDNLRDGSYTLVTMGSSDYFNAIYNLSQLSAVGLVEGADYVKHAVKVESGVVSVVEMESVPAFDESKLYYTGGDTRFTVNKTSATAGNYLTLTGKIDFKEEYASKVSDVSMVIDLPESAVFVDNSVMVGAAIAPYTLEGNRLTISLPGNYTERVRFCIIPTEGGSYAPTAFAQFTIDGKDVLQPIGSAHYTVKDLSINVPSISVYTTIPVSGTAIGQSTIQIYDNDVLIGETTSLANGVWNATCELHEPYNLSKHRIHAKVTTKLGLELTSETKECMYDMNYVQVSKVTMYYNGNVSVFDFQNPTTKSQSYTYSSNTAFTFTLEFNQNDPSKISNIILYVKTMKNEWIPLYPKYDAAKCLWVTSARSSELGNSYPVNVSVDYQEKSILWGDPQKLTSDMNDVQVAFESWKADLESLDSVFNNDDIILKNSDIYDELEYLLSQENYDADRVNILLEQLKANNPDYEESNVELPDDFDFEKEREEVDMIYSQIVTEGKDSLLASLLINEDLFDGEFCIEPIVYEPEGGEYKLIMNIISSVDEWKLSQKGYVSLPMTDSTVIWCKISDDSISFIDPIREIEITKITFNESQTRSMNISRGLGDTPTSCIDVAQGLLGMFRDDDSVEAWRSNCDVIKSIMDGIACFYELMHNNATKNDILDMLKALKDAEKARYNAWLKIISDKRVIPASDVSHLKDIEKSVAKIEKSIDEVNKFLNGPINRLLNRLPSRLTENLPRLSNNVRTLGRVAGGFGILLKLYDTYLDCRDFMDEIDSWTRLREMIERKIPCEGNQERALELRSNIIAEGRALQNNCIRIISADVIGIAADAASLKLKNPTGVLSLYVGSIYLGLYTELSKQLSIDGKFFKERTQFTHDVAMLKCGKNDPEPPEDDGGDYQSQTPDLTPCIDPSGYVYEGVSSNRLEGVMASCYYKETVEDIYGDQHENIVLWDAELYAQENPLFTDANGMYRWDVPKGLWQVKFEKEGYETTYSEWLPVPPPQLEVNIPMVQNKQPEVAGVHAYKDGVEIEFDKYMQPATLNTDNIFVTQNDEKVAGTVTLLNEEVAYEGQSETYASKVRFVFDQAITAKEITLTVVNSVKSYAGLQMQDTYTQTFAIEQEVEGIVADSLVSMYYGGEHTLTVKVIPAAAAAGKTLVVTSSSPTILGVDTDSVVLDDSGEAVLTVSGELPGMGAISYSLVGYDYRASTLVEVVYNNTKMTANPTASIASGTTVAKGTEVTLSCSTEGAAIYYTLDGSCPCDDTAILYDGTPIVINENTELRIMAVAEGMYESDVVVYNYYVEGADVEEVTLPFAIDPTIVTDGFRVQGIETECTVAVYGVGGELVMQREHVKNNTFINIAHVPEGMYIVVVSKDDDIHKQRILKVK